MNLLQRLHEKGIQARKDADLMIDIHHELMKFYHCWIPLDELKKIPIPMLIGLLERIEKDKKKPEPIPVVIAGYLKRWR